MARTPPLINMKKIENDFLQPCLAELSVSSYTLVGRIIINASSPDGIEVERDSDWLSEGELKFIHGARSIRYCRRCN